MSFYFSSLIDQDRQRWGQVHNALRGVADNIPSEMLTYWANAFQDPTEFAQAVMRYMLGQVGSQGLGLTPGYRDQLLKQAGAAYLFQHMQNLAGGNPLTKLGSFPHFLVDRLTSGVALPRPDEMGSVWSNLINNYRLSQSPESSPEMKMMFSSLTPQDLYAMHALAVQSTLSPFAARPIKRFLDNLYTDWATYTMATPNWLDVLNQISSNPENLFGR